MGQGFVSLVGAGPGSADLITLRGLRRLRQAEVVIYDRLVDPDLLEEAPDDAERIFAGKGAGFAALGQRTIEALLIDRAWKGKQVVRLKGGDPFLFGRGGEEVEALVAAGIAYEVVPGVTSALAVPAVADIPVTHRELASQLTIVTGHEDPDKAEPATDWAWLARSRGTVVILMGLDRLPDICRRLIEEGKGTHTPAAVISRGTLPDQRTVAAPLGQLAAVAAGSHLRSPAVIVVGEVARFPEMLAERLAAWPAAV